jgi:predicted ATPase
MKPMMPSSLKDVKGEIGSSGSSRTSGTGWDDRTKRCRCFGEAVDLAERTGLQYWDAELRRLKGTFLLHSRRAGRRPARSAAERDAESCFREAIEIARRQMAKSFELRAAMSLGRLWQERGKIGQAHALLSEIHGWFTEGFDTLDLVDARALREQLDRRR